MGKKIQNYILQTVVGSGQFGKVYKAYDQKTNQIVAIKVIQIEKFRLSPKLQEFTINEINTLSNIQDSTHIVRFIEILKTANNYYFVYEFCNDGTLEERIKAEGKFTEEKALGYFEELLKAFKMLVKNNIMHRDIKPSNILLNNGVIKLADFGFCKPMKDSKDLAQTMLGSPIYMAPQILKGQIYTMKADIWSLGVVLYEMLYGFCPFEERSIARLINLIEQGTVTFPANVRISKNAQQLLRRMLVKDQFKRIQWGQLLDYNLFANKQQRQTNSNPVSFQNSRPSLGYFQQQKDYKSSSKKQPQQNKASNNTANNPQTLVPQLSPQQPISNPFTKKHFQSVNNNNSQCNDFGGANNHHQLSNNSALDQREKQRERQKQKQKQKQREKQREKQSERNRRYLEPTKQDYSNRNNSNNRKYLNNNNNQGVSHVYEHSDKLNADKGISQQKDRKRSNTVHDIRQATNVKQKQNILSYQSNCNNIMHNITITPGHQLSLKKTKSPSIASISDIQKKIIQNILQKRQKILKGVKMIQKLLSQSSSKLNVSICCFIAKRIKLLALQAQDTIKKCLKQRQYRNKQKENVPSSLTANTQIDKSIALIQEEIKQIKLKLEPFEHELAQINQPQDIIFLRYGQEEHLTQEKEGLSQLLMIDDYLNISPVSKNNVNQVYTPSNVLQNHQANQQTRTPHSPLYKQTPQSSSNCSLEQNYQIRTKKELLEEYQRRVLRNV